MLTLSTNMARMFVLLQEPVIYIIQNRKNYTANDLCGILNPGCGQVNENLTNWTVKIDSGKPPVQTLPLLPVRLLNLYFSVCML